MGFPRFFYYQENLERSSLKHCGMYLRRIELSGFKSFAKKTAFDFPGSVSGAGTITAVVGPNGSGKSNVADAVRWVLGEQSLKSLRGTKSEDVIFHGSAKHARSGAAMVSLVFDNSSKALPIEYEEVIVTRKLFRNGESDYLLNGSKVRLLDIQELLAHGRISQRSYCIVTQGLADEFLRANPVERKLIIEDAIGVKPYQIKKRYAQRKMNTAIGNMERAQERVRELQPQLRSLKRQVKKMEKRKELEEALQQKQQQWFGEVWTGYRSEQDVLTTKRDTFLSDVSTKRRDLTTQEKKRTSTRRALEKIIEKRRGVEQETEQLQGEWNALQQELVVLRGNLQLQLQHQGSSEVSGDTNLPMRIQELELVCQELSEKKRSAKARLDYYIKEQQKLLKEQKEHRTSLSELRSELERIETQSKEQDWDQELVTSKLKSLLTLQQQILSEYASASTLQEYRLFHDRLEACCQQLDEAVQLCETSGVAQENDAYKKMSREAASHVNVLEQLSSKLLKADVSHAQYKEAYRMYSEQEERELQKKKQFEKQLSALHKKVGSSDALGVLQKEEKQLQKKLKSIEEKRSVIIEKRHQSEQEEQELRSDMESQEMQIAEQRKLLHGAEEDLHRLQVELASVETNIQHCEEEILRECGKTFFEQLQHDQYVLGKNISHSFLRSEIEQLKSQLQLLGGIDPLIVEEYEELSERFAFYNEQINDLDASIQKLQGVVAELDKKIEHLFLKSFSAIKKAFQNYFRILFDGGDASLKLVDIPLHDSVDEEDEVIEEEGEDPGSTAKKRTEIGIDVTAVPPGKKMKDLSLLSGGERSITSIALLFAVMSSNPPPFSVLDEIDAALDETNTQRFGKLLSELSKKTQFIVITHKRETMRYADTLYGVAMQADGVSKLLSVSLSEFEE